MTTISAKNIKTALEFRHACKKFDAKKTITDEDMTLILEAIQLAPTSYGFEQFNVIVAQDAALREALKKHSGTNSARFDASHMLIFTAKTSAGVEPHIDHMLKDVKKLNLVARTGYKTYWKNWAKKSFKLFDEPGTLHQWAARQAYIALGFAMLTAAERGIDSCPLEGFAIDEVAQILTDFKLIDPEADQPVVMLALGYRADKQPARSRRQLDEIVRWY